MTCCPYVCQICKQAECFPAVTVWEVDEFVPRECGTGFVKNESIVFQGHVLFEPYSSSNGYIGGNVRFGESATKEDDCEKARMMPCTDISNDNYYIPKEGQIVEHLGIRWRIISMRTMVHANCTYIETELSSCCG